MLEELETRARASGIRGQSVSGGAAAVAENQTVVGLISWPSDNPFDPINRYDSEEPGKSDESRRI